ncbi:hypothetical protein [Dickeya solani]|uniref:Uncharacterized protein n=1 Tax=Dickeya solani TaxID=1089444 RepID=A0AAX4EYQ6_9GAMM|nr:hypothetical protein [Dickeya solani]WOA52521.1 hypothetical protein RXA29_22135 [Dickeya solani]
MKYTKIKDRLLENVGRHEMTIHRDDGMYRHIQFSQPGTSCYRFDLVTWPGYLCVTGDMGCWTFSRIADMFEFFNDGIGRGINPGYWSEKLQAGAGSAYRQLCFEWDRDAFIKALREWHKNWLDEGRDEDVKVDVEDALSTVEENADDAYAAWRSLEDADLPEFYVYDFMEGGFERYTTHYLWICYAIVWGIQRYNESKTVVPVEASHDQP